MTYKYTFKVDYDFGDGPDAKTSKTFIEETEVAHMVAPCKAFLNFMRASGYVIDNDLDDNYFAAEVVDLLTGKTK